LRFLGKANLLAARGATGHLFCFVDQITQLHSERQSQGNRNQKQPMRMVKLIGQKMLNTELTGEKQRAFNWVCEGFCG
jgi:hypothetical protein